MKAIFGLPIFVGVIGLGIGEGQVAPSIKSAVPTWLAVLSLLLGLGLVAGWSVWKRR